MKIYVIRHGEVDLNTQGLINAHNNYSLNKKGIEQAKEASKRIKELDLDLIFCSPLQRTVETCEYINFKKIPVKYDGRLVERDAGNLQYKSVEIIDQNIWYDRTKTLLYENTEGFKSILDRVKEFLDELKENYYDKNILLVTHGDTFRAIYAYFNAEVTDNEIREYKKENCEIEKFEM